MQIIDNKERKVAEVINNLMPAAEALYFRTGYFFFSGYKEIYKNLGNKKIKILVGKDIQKDVSGIIQELNYASLENKPKSKIRQDYYRSLVNTFSDINEVDNKETKEAYEIFKKKILDGTLEVRKTLQPDHSKVYVFENSQEHNQNGEYLGAVLKGSSNLTFSGLVGQDEDNELKKDNEAFSYYKEKFEELWESSVELIDKNYLEDFKKHVVSSNIWVEQLPRPYDVYLRVLFEYFSLDENESILTPSKLTQNKTDLKYQIDAIRQALEIINKHNGVIIADVVGLGKSIIASTVARNLKLKTIVISPPHLVDQWEDYRYEFGFNAKVYGTGSVLKAIEENNEDERKLIIVDEAHKFRNEEKSLYANLHRLCKGNKVILLTATPFNNDPKDIFSLIKLFQISAKSTIQTVDNLSLRFKELMKQYNQLRRTKTKDKSSVEIQNLANSIRDLLGPLLIRRSRLDLLNIDYYKEDLENQGISFPEVASPISIKYDFGELEDLYLETLSMIAPEDLDLGLKGARYNVIGYINNDLKLKELAMKLNIDENLVKNSQKNLAKFMKRLLVHRFESSVEAFRKSLDNMISSYERIENWYKRGKVPIYKQGDLPDVDELYELADESEDIQSIEEIFSEYEEKGLELIDTNDISEDFLIDLKKDISLLKRIREMWEDFDPNKDPKLKELKQEIKKAFNENKDRKILIFSTYSDTVNYLYKNLKNDFRIFKYTGSDASESNKKIIKYNFDASSDKQENEFDILLTTDVISEGYNLHRAGIVFNYDIPYNPTKVIQRVGRINRVNKKVYDKLYIYNFFPSPTGEREIGIKRISTLKIDLIKALLGDDTQYLTADELIKSYSNTLEQEIKNTEELSWDYKYRNLYFKMKNSPELEKAMKIALRSKIKRSDNKNYSNNILVFGKKGSNYAFKSATPEGVVSVSSAEAIKLFEADQGEESKEVSDKFYELYETVKKNLFVRKTEVPKDKGIVEALDKIQYIKNHFKEHEEYFDDLEYVLKDLGDLPFKFAKSIRSLRKEFLEEDIKSLKNEVPHSYLQRIINEADSVGEGSETLILAEEF